MSKQYGLIDVAKDILNGSLEGASKELVEQRKSICDSCEVQNKTLHVCTACGCFIPAKVLILKTDCPMELWPQPTQQNTTPT